MQNKNRNIEFIDQAQERKEMKGFSLKGFIDGSFLTLQAVTKQLPFILFLTLLAVIYIANRYKMEKTVRIINSLKEEVKNLQSEQITTTSELLKWSKPTKVFELVTNKELGLIEPETPPVKLKKHKQK